MFVYQYQYMFRIYTHRWKTGKKLLVFFSTIGFSLSFIFKMSVLKCINQCIMTLGKLVYTFKLLHFDFNAGLKVYNLYNVSWQIKYVTSDFPCFFLMEKNILREMLFSINVIHFTAVDVFNNSSRRDEMIYVFLTGETPHFYLKFRRPFCVKITFRTNLLQFKFSYAMFLFF